MIKLLRHGALLVSGIILSAAPARGQANADTFMPYTVRHAQVERLVEQLGDAVDAAGHDADIVSDARSGRILVRGTPQAHRLVQTLLRSMDAPPASGAAPRTDDDPRDTRDTRPDRFREPDGDVRAARPRETDSLRSPEPLRPTARDQRIARAGHDALMEEDRDAARVAPDRGVTRDSQYRDPTYDSPERMTRRNAPERDGSSESPGRTSTRITPDRASSYDSQDRETSTRRMQLSHVSTRRFEELLSDLAGSPTRVHRSPDGDVAEYEVQQPDGASVRIHVSRESGRLLFDGSRPLVDALCRVVEAVDAPAGRGASARLVVLRHAKLRDLADAVDVLRSTAGASTNQLRGARFDDSSAVRRAFDERSSQRRRTDSPGAPRHGTLLAMFYQGVDGQDDQPADQLPERQPLQPMPNGQQPMPNGQQPPDDMPPQIHVRPDTVPPLDLDEGIATALGLVGRVRIEPVPGSDMLIIIGDQRDVDRVMQLIEQIERQAAVTRPVVVVRPLRHANSSALAPIVLQVYNETFALRQGTVSITPLVKPNALLIIGRESNIQTVNDLVRQLDRPVDPDTQLRVFRLGHASSSAVRELITAFFTAREGLGTRGVVISDYRSNSVVVHASPRDLAEIERLVRELDVPSGEAVNEMRVVRLFSSLAAELAPVIQLAIAGPAVQPDIPGQPQAQQATTGVDLQQQRVLQARSIMMQMLTVRPDGTRQISSGILTDVRVTADARANALIVTAPRESIDLVVALIETLDRLPPAEAQIKVFRIFNADATQLSQALQTLFPAPAPGQPVSQTASGDPEGSTLIPIRISVEPRSNSIIASGSAADLVVVETILLRLDDEDARERRRLVYRLKNSPAVDVANAVTQFIQSERQLQQQVPQLVSPYELLEREVVVVPEIVSNALIISATPRYFDEVVALIERLDERPPMVMVQVLIAEVTLGQTDEFGVELGIQDSILFDRSVGGVPGFNFNSGGPLGSGAVRPELVGGQALSNLAVGRSNPTLGFGGLVLSASSESVSVLVRALQQQRRLDVLSRPQIMTLDNQPAFVQVGQLVPRVTGLSFTQLGQVFQDVTDAEVGLILGVTPRISPDGLVVMEIDVTRSDVGPEEEGIPIGAGVDGTLIRSPKINITTARTTVSAATGQTVVLSGLITKGRAQATRKVPWLGDLPVVGRLFRYDNITNDRTELLIILTPQIVRKGEDNERVKWIESARLNWCLADVFELHGPGGPAGLGLAEGNSPPTIFPDLHPGVPHRTRLMPHVLPPAGEIEQIAPLERVEQQSFPFDAESPNRAQRALFEPEPPAADGPRANRPAQANRPAPPDRGRRAEPFPAAE